MQAKGNSHANLWKSLTHFRCVASRLLGYAYDIYYELTLYSCHDSCNKLQRTPAHGQNPVPTQAYYLYKNAHSNEKELKTRKKSRKEMKIDQNEKEIIGKKENKQKFKQKI